MRKKENDAPMSKSNVIELKRRIKDLHDQTRYLVVSQILTMKLFYCVSTHTYVMNRINNGTRFKSLDVAKSVAITLREKKDNLKPLEVWQVKESKSKKTVKFIRKIK